MDKKQKTEKNAGEKKGSPKQKRHLPKTHTPWGVPKKKNKSIAAEGAGAKRKTSGDAKAGHHLGPNRRQNKTESGGTVARGASDKKEASRKRTKKSGKKIGGGNERVQQGCTGKKKQKREAPQKQARGDDRKRKRCPKTNTRQRKKKLVDKNTGSGKKKKNVIKKKKKKKEDKQPHGDNGRELKTDKKRGAGPIKNLGAGQQRQGKNADVQPSPQNPPCTKAKGEKKQKRTAT